MDWSHVDYLWIIVMFLSAVWTHFNGTHLLQRIHWYASDEQVSNLIMMTWGRVIFQQIFIFG